MTMGQEQIRMKQKQLNGIQNQLFQDDKIKTFEWYTKAAENGDAVAQNNIGDCCKYGKRTDKDDKKAFGWYLNSGIKWDSLNYSKYINRFA